MENFDAQEVIPMAENFMKKSKDDGKPFFVWLNTSRMHLYTHLDDKWKYAAEKYTSEADIHGSGMLQHDHDIGLVLKWLEDQGLLENTVIWYSTDNGPEHVSWPHGGTTPWRGQKMGTTEGGVRVVSMLRYPKEFKAGTIKNGIQAHMDMFTTFAEMAGVKDVNGKMMKEKKQYIDGVNNLAYWRGQQPDSNRDMFYYYYESKLAAVRMDQWKWHFIWKEDYYSNTIPLTVPRVFNLRMDPFESYDTPDSYGHLMQKVSWMMNPLGKRMNEHIKTLMDYPPVQGGKSFDMSNVIEQVMKKGNQ